jgi:KTSC domain
MPEWKQLESSNLKRCSYDIETETLQIQFISGKVYTYQGVPASVYNGLLEATSAGQYFNSEIKNVYG